MVNTKRFRLRLSIYEVRDSRHREFQHDRHYYHLWPTVRMLDDVLADDAGNSSGTKHKLPWIFVAGILSTMLDVELGYIACC